MARKPNWNQEEFEVIVDNPTTSSEALAVRLPGRSPDSIQLIRAGLHAFHSGKDTSMLSKLMLARLENNQNEITCPVCGTMF